jgi:hypothetical protein
VGGTVPIDNEMLLVTDFVNLKIKSSQSFRCAYKSRMHVCVYRSDCSYMYYLYLYCVFFKRAMLVILALARSVHKVKCVLPFPDDPAQS